MKVEKNPNIEMIVNDIMQCFRGDINYESNQKTLGIQNVLRKIVAKVQIIQSREEHEDYAHNTVIILLYAEFYSQSWKYLNETLNDEESQRKRMSNCYEDVTKEVDT